MKGGKAKVRSVVEAGGALVLKGLSPTDRYIVLYHDGVRLCFAFW